MCVLANYDNSYSWQKSSIWQRREDAASPTQRLRAVEATSSMFVNIRNFVAQLTRNWRLVSFKNICSTRKHNVGLTLSKTTSLTVSVLRFLLCILRSNQTKSSKTWVCLKVVCSVLLEVHAISSASLLCDFLQASSTHVIEYRDRRYLRHCHCRPCTIIIRTLDSLGTFLGQSCPLIENQRACVTKHTINVR